MHKRRRIERDLAAMKNRDEIIREAYAEGFLKKEIHERSGVARTTIDRILKENRVPVHKVTAATTQTGPSWERSIAAWIEAARDAGHNATDTGETVNERNSRPVILVDGEHYVLSRDYDPAPAYTVVTVDYKAVKTERGWVSA